MQLDFPGDPDGRVLEFNASDHFITPLPGLVTIWGSGITDINIPTGIASFPGTRDVVLTQSSEGVAYGEICMIYQQKADFDWWLPKFDRSDSSVSGTPFIKPNQYAYAGAVTIHPI